MVTLADRQYTLEDFDTFIVECARQTPMCLPEATHKQISFLADKVGAPTYNKTPNFKRTRRGPMQKCSPENWEAMRNFKATKIEKNVDGISKQIDDMILLLNKITDDNYSDMLTSIKKIMQNVVEKKLYKEEDMIKLGESIFIIGSSNKFYSKLYSSLYKDLIKFFPFMKDICVKNFKSFMNLFNTIENADPNSDYDIFCRINKDNANRRAISYFFVNLMMNNTLEVTPMFEFVHDLVKKHEKYISIENSKSIVDEISENIFIIVTMGHEYFQINNGWVSILEYIRSIIQLKAKDKVSLTNKTIFKFMDILEMI